MRVVFIASILLIGSCRTDYDTYADRRADRILKVCAAGLSEKTSVYVEGIVSDSGGTLGASALNELRGAIFDDPEVQGQDRSMIYDRYIACVADGGVEIKQEDAETAIQRIQFTNDYRAASIFSSYDWVSSFSRGYKNIGDQPVECSLRVRGELARRSTRQAHDYGEIENFSFVLEPGEISRLDGEVGIKGFNDSRYQVTTSDRLECWYK